MLGMLVNHFCSYLEMFWGEGSVAIEGFFGCCNPANLCVLSNGRLVTAEKGLLRVKIFSADGQFECVVAGPEQLEHPTAVTGEARFDHEYKAVDVAADSEGRIVLLDLTTGKIDNLCWSQTPP